mmetsp:Transcript_164774/g.528654  ORF Transcript_164774/g.528654 Transcript_164774/m.528654 type:complete len:288 (-) Transcript_164774:27-890(-)
MRCSQRHKRTDHYQLRQPTAKQSGGPLLVFAPYPPSDDRTLLEVDHPRHDHRANVSSDELDEARVVVKGEGALENLAGRGVVEEHGGHKRQLEEAEANAKSLDLLVAAEDNHCDDDERRAQRGGSAADAPELSDRGEAAHLRHHGKQTLHHQQRARKGGPAPPEKLADASDVALLRVHGQPNRQLLRQEEDRNEQHLQREQGVAPPGAGLRGHDEAACVSVRQADQQPGAQEIQREPARRRPPVEARRSISGASSEQRRRLMFLAARGVNQRQELSGRHEIRKFGTE